MINISRDTEKRWNWLTLPYRVLVMIFYSDYASNINDNTDLAVAINANNKYITATSNTDINFRFTNKLLIYSCRFGLKHKSSKNSFCGVCSYNSACTNIITYRVQMLWSQWMHKKQKWRSVKFSADLTAACGTISHHSSRWASCIFVITYTKNTWSSFDAGWLVMEFWLCRVKWNVGPSPTWWPPEHVCVETIIHFSLFVLRFTNKF